MTLVDTEKTAILPFLNDIGHGHQFRQIAAISSERPLAGTEGPNVPYLFVGDEGSALNKIILRPFGGSDLIVRERVYSYRLCRA